MHDWYRTRSSRQSENSEVIRKLYSFSSSSSTYFYGRKILPPIHTYIYIYIYCQRRARVFYTLSCPISRKCARLLLGIRGAHYPKAHSLDEPHTHQLSTRHTRQVDNLQHSILALERPQKRHSRRQTRAMTLLKTSLSLSCTKTKNPSFTFLQQHLFLEFSLLQPAIYTYQKKRLFILCVNFKN